MNIKAVGDCLANQEPHEKTRTSMYMSAITTDGSIRSERVLELKLMTTHAGRELSCCICWRSSLFWADDGFLLFLATFQLTDESAHVCLCRLSITSVHYVCVCVCVRARVCVTIMHYVHLISYFNLFLCQCGIQHELSLGKKWPLNLFTCK